MVPAVQTLQLDEARVTVVNVGDFHAPLWDEWLRLTPAEWAQLEPGGPLALRPGEAAIGPVRAPILCFHLALPGMSLLIDAGAYPITGPHPFAIPGYQPPPDLLRSLADAGIDRTAIDVVVITHAHFDHFNGLTTEDGGALTPCFPQARHLLGRADWDAAQAALANPGSIDARTLGAVARAGLLDLVDGDLTLSDAVQIVALPGESPGHQVVRVRLRERTLWFLGDLYHHPAEVAHPTWRPAESDRDALLHSRRRLAERASAEGALLFAAHIPSAGRLERDGDGVRWEVVAALGDLGDYPSRVVSAKA